MPKAKTRKRPCCICRRWFIADSRQIGRQKSCGRAECQQELHRRQCKKWNQRNKTYYKAIYLSNKIHRIKDPPDPSQKKPPPPVAASRINLGLPKDVIIEITSTEQLIVVEYIFEQMMQRVMRKSTFRPP